MRRHETRRAARDAPRNSIGDFEVVFPLFVYTSLLVHPKHSAESLKPSIQPTTNTTSRTKIATTLLCHRRRRPADANTRLPKALWDEEWEEEEEEKAATCAWIAMNLSENGRARPTAH